MAKKKVIAIIPSSLRTDEAGHYHLERAVNSILNQSNLGQIELDISVGIDAGVMPPTGGIWDKVIFQVGEKSQAAALRAACRAINHDVVTMLEDDDEWSPSFLATSLAFLDHADFVSSTTLEVFPNGQIDSIMDFPIPSTWVMKSEVWRDVGPFDESYKWHADNEWLGRLSLTSFKRIHLVEATAPVTASSIVRRPWLLNVLRCGGNDVRIVRHSEVLPLVKRLVHPGSGMTAVATNPEYAEQGKNEYDLMTQRFGRVPW